jgi:hypothetical protein
MEERINKVAAEIYAIYRETAASIGLTSQVDDAKAVETIAFNLVDSCLTAAGVTNLNSQQLAVLSQLQVKLRDAMR